MTFDPAAPKVPTSIGTISVVLTDYIDEGYTDSAEYDVQVKDADGAMFALEQGNLLPHLSAAQISGLVALMADVRAKAQAFIPA